MRKLWGYTPFPPSYPPFLCKLRVYKYIFLLGCITFPIVVQTNSEQTKRGRSYGKGSK